MLTPPAGLSDDDLARVLHQSWGSTVASISNRPVGFGSHHWDVVDADAVRWFVTVDELDRRRHSETEPESATFARLRAALHAAIALRDSGVDFVIAPVPTSAGEPLARAGAFAVSQYPYIDGESYSWGEFSTPAHRHAVLDLVVALHRVPVAAIRNAASDDFAVSHRDALESVGNADEPSGRGGPYAKPTSELLLEHAETIRRLLHRYDELVADICRQPARMVVTHGEPHAANTMRTSGGWVLIDWETALIAPPERDLWSLDPGDGSVIRAYADTIGAAPRPSVLELYRIRWDLADAAEYVSRFRNHHEGTADDEKSWANLQSIVAGLH